MDDTKQQSLNEDLEYVQQFQANNTAAFDALVVKYQHKIVDVCYRLLGDYEEANDCAQDTFVKAYRALHTFRCDAAFSTWLYCIAINTCKNKRASLSYHMEQIFVRIDSVRPDDDTQYVEIKDSINTSPAYAFEQQEKDQFIQKALNTLPAAYKQVLVLRDIKGMSYEDIAAITGDNLNTMKTKLVRARGKMRKALQEFFS